jgi:uncharacterized protein YndB with AHSA1/START domain
MPAHKHKTIVTAEPGKQELFVTREFDAPRELVFRAFIDPDLYVQWLGPRGYAMKLETFEPRSGGSWRYTYTDSDGNEYGFHGVNHVVAAPERLVATFEFEGRSEAGRVALDSARFEAMPGNRTRITAQSVFQSVADRDDRIQAGMERGLVDSHERLDELLQRLQA